MYYGELSYVFLHFGDAAKVFWRDMGKLLADSYVFTGAVFVSKTDRTIALSQGKLQVGGTPKGYTTLHQAAYHRQSKEVVQKLI